MANFFTAKGEVMMPYDVEVLERTVAASRGCKTEYIVRDILTLHGNVHKIKRAVEIIREETEDSYR